MRIRATSNPAEFKATVFPFLQADPILHTSLLSNVEDRVNGLMHDPAPPVFLSVHDISDAVIGAAFCGASRGIQLGALPDSLVPEIVDVCAELAPNPDEIAGTASAARQLAELLAARNGKTPRQTQGIRLHKLDQFVALKADGAPRRAVAADVEVIAALMPGYRADVGHGLPAAEEEGWVRARIEAGRLWVWENEGRVVSLVGHQATLFRATRVGPVYTPPRDRGRGYAGALTAHVTRQLLDAGSQVCLHTDLANPTANKIYAAIGYRPLVDLVVYRLDPAVGAGELD
ncbi:GNAT family N-acetyltransferase [Kribbella sp. CA-294648]|uniref:GNAT family N-acetyltransferase n=1 Tax=Kribbella sp. CA-294648 TaxID=3239948 RepID=UPI003D8B1983